LRVVSVCLSRQAQLEAAQVALAAASAELAAISEALAAKEADSEGALAGAAKRAEAAEALAASLKVCQVLVPRRCAVLC
jgi:hypothetical protein